MQIHWNNRLEASQNQENRALSDLCVFDAVLYPAFLRLCESLLTFYTP